MCLSAESDIQYNDFFFSKWDEQNIFMFKEADLLVENRHLILTTNLKFCGCETQVA